MGMLMKLRSKSLVAGLAGLTLAGHAVAQIIPVDTGIETCPAYDILQQGILDYLSGVDPASLGEGDGELPIAIQFILDASGSMEGRIGDESKMSIAQTALATALETLGETQTQISLRSYGFDDSVPKTPEASCPNTALLTDFIQGDVSEAQRAANGLTPYGYTPIAASLAAAANDLSAIDARERVVVLISDGEETCGGDPVATAAEIAGLGVNLSTFVVGFDLDSEQAAQMDAIAQAGGGRYLDAPDASALAETLAAVTSVAVNKSERTMPRCLNPRLGGATPDDAVLIHPGIYTVGELLETGTYRYYRVDTEEGELGVVRGLLQAWRYHDGPDGPVEGSAALGAMTIQILERDGQRASARPARERDLPGTGIRVAHADTDGQGFLIGLGDNYERLSPESLIEVSIEAAHDGDGGDTDGEIDAPDIHSILNGESRSGHFGLDDEADVWRVEASGAIRIDVDLEDDSMRHSITIHDAASGRRIARGDAPFDLEPSGAILVRIVSDEPRLAPKFSGYEISVEPRP
jgi:Ca-activated chloride channel family protein